MCGASIPSWLDELFDGLDDLPAARQLIAATVAAELAGQLYAGGVRHFHFYTLNRAELQLCYLPLARREGQSMSATQTFRAVAAKRILIKDGPYGTAIQTERLKSDDYCGGLDLFKDQRGNNDLLNPRNPSCFARSARLRRCGRAEILATNTFNATRSARADYGAEDFVARINRSSAEIVREVADSYSAKDGRPRWVAGALVRPTRRFLCRPTSTIPPSARSIFDRVKAVYREQVDALVRAESTSS